MKPVIDRSLVADNLLFATHGDRCRYLGTPSWEKARWLNDNTGSFRRIDDIEEGSAPTELPVEDGCNVGIAPAEPACETSPYPGQKESDVALINTPPGDSPPYQPTSLPARVKAKVLDGSTRTELAPRAKALTSETSGPKTEAASLGEIGRSRGRCDGRQRKKQSQPGQISKADRKLSPKRMRLVLNSLRQYPFLWRAADEAGIHRKTLEYWIKRSRAGDDGYDIKWQGLTWRFHEHCISAIEEAHDRLLGDLWQIAMGVTFKTDADGNFIMETVGPTNPKMLRFLLEWWRPEKWGKHPRIDVPREGGVLVVGGSAKPENNTAASVKARKWKSISRKIRKTKG
jgi:hypothetical protein